MIKDTLKNAESYYNISSNLKIGFEWLRNTDLESISDGKYVINDNIYANVQSYDTKEDAPFEAHRKYIDIQYMIVGEECAEFTDYKNCETVIEYDGEKDIEFMECKGDKDKQILRSGEFFVFFPHDAHKPALDSGMKRFVKKVIVKVMV